LWSLRLESCANASSTQVSGSRSCNFAAAAILLSSRDDFEARFKRLRAFLSRRGDSFKEAGRRDIEELCQLLQFTCAKPNYSQLKRTQLPSGHAIALAARSLLMHERSRSRFTRFPTKRSMLLPDFTKGSPKLIIIARSLKFRYAMQLRYAT
jgi:hypothetical protein